MTPREAGTRNAEALAAKLKAVADPTRLRLIGIMRACGNGAACECELAGPMRLSQPTLSHHLKVLQRAGLVKRDPAGTPGQGCVYYRLQHDAFAELIHDLAAQVPP